MVSASVSIGRTASTSAVVRAWMAIERRARGDPVAGDRQEVEADRRIDGIGGPRAAGAELHGRAPEQAGIVARDVAVTRRDERVAHRCLRQRRRVVDHADVAALALHDGAEGRKAAAIGKRSAHRGARGLERRRALPSHTINAASSTDSSTRSGGPPPRSTSMHSRTSSALPIVRPSGTSICVSSAATRKPGALGQRDERIGQGTRVVFARHERAAAGLHVEHERVDALGDLLAQDRGADQRQALDGRGHVAQRVQRAVGRGDLVGLADQRAARDRRPGRGTRRA